jgi:hypothetical protein
MSTNPEAFARLPPDQQTLVKNAQIAIGFSTEAVRIALGNPKEITTQATPAGQIQIWYYEPEGYYENEPYSGGGGYSGVWDGWDGDSPVVGPPQGSDQLLVQFLDDRVYAIEEVVNGFKKSFAQAPRSIGVILSPYSGSSEIKSSNDIHDDARKLLESGYILLAVISYEMEDQKSMGQINDEAKRLGADVVLWSDKDMGTETMYLTVPGFDTSAGVLTGGVSPNRAKEVPFAIKRYALTVTFWRRGHLTSTPLPLRPPPRNLPAYSPPARPAVSWVPGAEV